MQLYVNVLIATSHGQPGHTRGSTSTSPHSRDDQIISLLTRQSECGDVLKFGGIKIFSSDDCEIVLWLGWLGISVVLFVVACLCLCSVTSCPPHN